jgi:hypothetical protein
MSGEPVLRASEYSNPVAARKTARNTTRRFTKAPCRRGLRFPLKVGKGS